MTTWIDESRIMEKVMPTIFQTGFPVIAELVQNSFRAGAENIRIESDPSNATFAIHDDGHDLDSIDDLLNLFVVGQSGFEGDPAIATAEPAGMGLYSLLATAEYVSITSGRLGKSVTINSDRWFGNQAYRDSLFERVEAMNVPPALGGLSIRATGVRDLPLAHDLLQRECQAFGVYARTIAIEVNGQRVEPFRPQQCFRHQLDLGIEGVDVWWWYHGAGQGTAPYMQDASYSKSIIVSWYGHRILLDRGGWGYHGERLYIQVSAGTPFHPRLPDRQDIRKDDDWRSFMAQIEEKVADHICAMDVDYLCGDGIDYLEYLYRFAPDQYRRRSPAALWNRIWGTGYDCSPTAGHSRVAYPVTQPVYTLGSSPPIHVVDRKGVPYMVDEEKKTLRLAKEGEEGDCLQFDLDCNSATLGFLLEEAGDQAPPICVPWKESKDMPHVVEIPTRNISLYVPESDIVLYDHGWGVTHAKAGTLVLDTAEENIELNADEAVFKGEELNWPGEDDLFLVAKDLSSLPDKARDFLLWHRDDSDADSFETQVDDWEKELARMCSELRRSLRILSEPLHSWDMRSTLNLSGLQSIQFIHNGGVLPHQAVVTIDQPDDPDNNKQYQAFVGKALELSHNEELGTVAGTFNID